MRHPIKVLAAVLLLMGASAAPLLAAQEKPKLRPGETIRGQHGNWQIVCKKAAGSEIETCAAVQSVTAEDRPNVGLTVYLQKFSDGRQVLRVFAPLGVLLPTGLGLKIDGQDVGNAPFLRCHSFACFAQVAIDDALIKKLRDGKTAIFIVFQTQDEGIGIPISLAGFDEALKSL